jgi:hypothetical protein
VTNRTAPASTEPTPSMEPAQTLSPASPETERPHESSSAP